MQVNAGVELGSIGLLSRAELPSSIGKQFILFNQAFRLFSVLGQSH